MKVFFLALLAFLKVFDEFSTKNLKITIFILLSYQLLRLRNIKKLTQEETLVRKEVSYLQDFCIGFLSEMDSLAGFQLDGDLPDVIFEDDEIEFAVVKPILNDVIKNVIKDTGDNQSKYQTIDLSVLQKFNVDVQLQNVSEETQTKKDNDYIKSLISGCVDLAFNQAKLSGELIF